MVTFESMEKKPVIFTGVRGCDNCSNEGIRGHIIGLLDFIVHMKSDRSSCLQNEQNTFLNLQEVVVNVRLFKRS